MTKSPSALDDGRAPGEIPLSEIEAILAGRHANPFAVLGLHKLGEKYRARCFIPGAEEVTVLSLSGAELGELTCRHEAGYFEGLVDAGQLQPIRYRAQRGDVEWAVTDPYSFGPVLGPMDDYLLREGSHLRLFDKMGAHPLKHEGVEGFHFAVWAPNARRVSVVGEFNNWDGRRHVMRLRQDTGIWEIFAPDVRAGAAYKFEIIGKDGKPVCTASRDATEDCLGNIPGTGPGMGRSGSPGILGKGRSSPTADHHLRSACRIMAAPRRRIVSLLG